LLPGDPDGFVGLRWRAFRGGAERWVREREPVAASSSSDVSGATKGRGRSWTSWPRRWTWWPGTRAAPTPATRSTWVEGVHPPPDPVGHPPSGEALPPGERRGAGLDPVLPGVRGAGGAGRRAGGTRGVSRGPTSSFPITDSWIGPRKTGPERRSARRAGGSARPTRRRRAAAGSGWPTRQTRTASRSSWPAVRKTPWGVSRVSAPKAAPSWKRAWSCAIGSGSRLLELAVDVGRGGRGAEGGAEGPPGGSPGNRPGPGPRDLSVRDLVQHHRGRGRHGRRGRTHPHRPGPGGGQGLYDPGRERPPPHGFRSGDGRAVAPNSAASSAPPPDVRGGAAGSTPSSHGTRRG
jgi:hypothetical protein